MPITRLLLASAVLAAVAGCGGGGSPSTQGPLPPAGQTVTVEVRPKEIQVAPGGTVDFTSVVTGTADTTVTWETDGGTISQTGSYVAPLAAGTYTVSATSRGNGLAKGRSKVVVTPTPAPITVSVSPASTSVGAGGTVAFTATVGNATDPSVTWTVREAGCGTVSAGGVYTAPGAAATCHVVAASVADPAATAEAAVTVSAPTPPGPVAVTVSPASGTVDACRTLTFTATVTGAASGAVTWSVQEGAAGGSITSGGVYTAPNAAGTYHVIATSQASGTASAVAAVTVSDRILGVSVSPATVELAPGASAQFTATITTTCGAYATTQTITAPN
ncbi:hypothetical protein [Anaeromyxobacter dehalogenans]|uniref:Calcium-binding outer membrane-like protein n=1 Tax=Anaeromyxobacter dehalogenans (strain 2CP-C) TaxID=290397 RepID=Q2IQ97_ANADE|nr:hypothetical protein [Anaeromyxobacter dehalogenans]ABC80982.1 calcium-binding outer membrane-like protein [Anaeromyxobacter dehalogenans 2CP-C]